MRLEIWRRSSLLTIAALVSCSPGAGDPADRRDAAAETEIAAEPAAERVSTAPSPDEWPVIEQTLTYAADSVDRLLRRVPNLTRNERAGLRRDVNAIQTAMAQRMGIRPGSDVEPLVEAGRLVLLPDTTRYWVVRELDYSVPYVTPDTEAMLAEIGERFHAKLDSLNIPRYRLEITSVLRTRENQQALRRRNPNAAAGTSAHEYGTTVDIAYRTFGPPAGVTQAVLDGRLSSDPQVRQLGDSLLVETGRQRGAELQAVLGRVLQEMKREGKLLVMMEQQQTVYHMTVARRFPDRKPVPAE
jgi:hypothetical protein